MITFLQAVNRVLVKLREPELSSFSALSAYPKLISAFVNEAKEEVEAAWDWNYQRATYTVSTVASTSTYAVTGAGSELTLELVTQDGFIINGPIVNTFVDANRAITGVGATSGTGTYVDIIGIDSNGDVQIRVTPTPSSSGTITIYGRSKQAYLDTASDSGTYIKAPWRPIVFLAYAKAVSERGDDGGAAYDESMVDYTKALADAVARDSKLNFRNTDWYAD